MPRRQSLLLPVSLCIKIHVPLEGQSFSGSIGMSHWGLDVTVYPAALPCPVLISRADFPQHRGEVEFLYLTADSSLCDDLTGFVHCVFQSKGCE